MLEFKKPKKFQIQKEINEDYWLSILESGLNSIEWRMDYINNVNYTNELMDYNDNVIYTNTQVNPSFYENVTITGVSIGGFYERPIYYISIDPFIPNIGLTACTTTLMNESNI